MRETWVHPVTEGREARPAWIAVWRFRAVLLLLLVVAVVVALLCYRAASGNGGTTGIPQASGSAGTAPAHRTSAGIQTVASVP